MNPLVRLRKLIVVLAVIVIVGVIGSVMVDQAFATCTGPSPFPDMADDHWSCAHVSRIYDLNIVEGLDGEYIGTELVNKYVMAIFVDRLTQANTEDDANVPYVFNLVNDSAAAEGDVIKAYSTNGEGVEGYSSGGDTADTGVYGQSNGTGSSDAGVRGYASGAGPGLYGQGVGASSTSYGVRGVSSSADGVYGESNAGSTAYFGGWFSGGKGVFGQAEHTSGDGTYGYCTDGNSCWGARGHSTDGYGVQGNTSRSDQRYGLHTSDMLYAGAGINSVSGFSYIVQNGGAAALEKGDTVVVSGMTEPFEANATPLLQVERATAATSPYIVGVVETALRIEMVAKPAAVYEERRIPDPEGQEADDAVWTVAEEVEEMVAIHHTVEGPARPGDYVQIRVQGMAQVRVDATAAPIVAGMPLTAGGDGTAQAVGVLREEDRAAGPRPLIIGQAMEALADGEGLIWVLVNPR